MDLSNIFKLLSNLISILKETRTLFAIFLFCLILVLLPNVILESLGLLYIVNLYRGFLSLIVIFTLIVLLIEQYPKASNYLKEKRKFKNILKRLDYLSVEEKNIIKYCLKNNQQTIVKPTTDPAINSLCDKGLLLEAEQGHIMAYSFTIPDDIWEYLRKNKELFNNKR
ncbi:TPA: super-infection exclusion protein B [Legionella pneumophila]